MDERRDNSTETGEHTPLARRAEDPPLAPDEHASEQESASEATPSWDSDPGSLLTPHNYGSPLPPPELSQSEPPPPQPSPEQPQQQPPPGYQPPPVPPAYQQQPAVWRQPAPPQASRPFPGAVEIEGVTWVPAGLAPRVLAFFIDGVILALAGQALVLIAGIPEPDINQILDVYMRIWSEILATGVPAEHSMALLNELARPIQLANWLNVAMCFCYFTVFHWLAGGTLGKLSLGLRVLRRDGRRLSLGWASLRYLGYFLCAKLAYTAWFIPLNAERRTLYDFVLGTNVFKMKR